MNFQCKNCNANMIYDPGRKKMYCPYCDSLDSDVRMNDQTADISISRICPSCSGEFEVTEFQSTVQCPFCSNYIILNDRVSGKYRPDNIIPFAIPKEKAISILEYDLDDYLFAPASFLSKKKVEKMQGRYVPYFLYDMDAAVDYEVNATKTRSWSEGNYRYTEESKYHLIREMSASYDRITAEASDEMLDSMTESLEPFDFKEIEEFNPKYMSGFYGEVYNQPPEAFLDKARSKAENSIGSRLKASLADFSVKDTPQKNEITVKQSDRKYALLPVWHYRYLYDYRVYDIYVNGQNGQTAGDIPKSKLKVFLYGFACAAMWVVLLDSLFGIFGSLISRLLEI